MEEIKSKIMIDNIKQLSQKIFENQLIRPPIFTVTFPANTNVKDVVNIKQLRHFLVSREKFKPKN